MTGQDDAAAGPAPGRPFVEPVGLRPLAVAPMLGVLVFGFLGYRSANAWLILLACAAAGPFVISWLGRPRLETMSVASGGAPRAVVGEPAAWVAVVRNDGRRTSPPLLLVDRVAGYDDQSVLVGPIAPGGTAHVRTARPARRRGLADGHEVTLSTTAPFGMVERRRVLANRRTSVVHPPLGRPAEVLARGGDGDDLAGVPARTGADVHAVREWRPGDDARHVHWRSTARHGRVVVVEPERTVARRLAILVAGERGSDAWEPLLERVAGTVVAAVRADREVLLLARDARAAARWPAGGGAGGVEDCRDADGLAGLVARDAADLLDLVAALDDVTPPHGHDLQSAAAWAGAGADVVVATTRPFEPTWWDDVTARAAAIDVRLTPLTSDGAP